MVIKNFDIELESTFESGQCFRWEKIHNDFYIGVIKDMVVKAKIFGNDLKSAFTYVNIVIINDF